MITRDNLTEIGVFNKPHGISGEINVTIYRDIDIASLRCIVIDMDGIYVPFFVNSIRPRGAETVLLTIEGVATETQAATFTGKSVYVLDSDCGELGVHEDNAEDDGMYAEDFIGYSIIDTDSGFSGKIVDVDDSTDNVLFIVESDNSRRVFIPVAEEFIQDIDTETRIVEVNLPEGLLEI